MIYQTVKPFPFDFLWGASTSAYQVEGASREDGKGPSCQDVKPIPEGTSGFETASDHYHRFREDIALMAEMGLKAYRFSIAWSRVLPEGAGAVNPLGIQFYRDLIDACLGYGIEPIVTMYHFDMPQALEERGGWSNRESVQWFADYAALLFDSFGGRVKYWLTINEQNMMTLMGDVIGTAPGKDRGQQMKDTYQRNHHMLLAQAKACVLCHEMLPGAKIGPAPNISLIYPASQRPEDNIAAQNFNAIRNWLYLDIAVFGEYNRIAWSYLEENGACPEIQPGDMELMQAAKPDFIAFNYYNTGTVRWAADGEAAQRDADQQKIRSVPGVYAGVRNSFLPKTQFGWEIDPVGFRATLREICSRYRLPVMVTENGMGAHDTLVDGQVHDDYRIDYLRRHIEQMQLAITDGCKVIAYCPWSAIDLISTHEGVAKRYGFIYVDRDEFDLKTLNRYRKDSFFWYKKVIAANGADLTDEAQEQILGRRKCTAEAGSENDNG